MINTSYRNNESKNLSRLIKLEASSSLSLLNNIVKDKQAYLHQLKQANMFKNFGKLQQNFKYYLNNHKEKPFKSLITNKIYNLLNQTVLKQKKLSFELIKQGRSMKSSILNKYNLTQGNEYKIKHFIFIIKQFQNQHKDKLIQRCFKQIKNFQKNQVDLEKSVSMQMNKKILNEKLYQGKIKSSKKNVKDNQIKDISINYQIADKSLYSCQSQLNKQSLQEQKNCLLNKISQLESNFREMALKYVTMRESLQQEARMYNCNLEQDPSSLSISKAMYGSQADSQKFSYSLDIRQSIQDQLQVHRLSQRNQELNQQIDQINTVVEDLFLTNFEQMNKFPKLTAILSQIKQISKSNILGLLN